MEELERVRTHLARDVDGGFPDLVDAVLDDLHAGVRRLVRDPGRAEDVVQEVLLAAHQALLGYGPERIGALRLRPWLWTIALNRVRNEARRRGRRPIEVAPGEREPVAPSGSAEDVALGAMTDPALEAALGSLSSQRRTAVVLRHVVGLTGDEIAAATGRTPVAVRTDVHRGLRQLAASLDAPTGAGEEPT